MCSIWGGSPTRPRKVMCLYFTSTKERIGSNSPNKQNIKQQLESIAKTEVNIAPFKMVSLILQIEKQINNHM